MDESEFERLIRRYLSGRATAEERSLIDGWLDHRSQKKPFGRLSDADKKAIGIKIFNSLSAKMNNVRSGPGEIRRSRLEIFYRVAAAILVFCAVSYTFLTSESRSDLGKITAIQSASSVQGNKKVILSDSTIVWLKGESVLLFPTEFKGTQRLVGLTGEALFEVTKDPVHPFIIQCGNLNAKVLGTSFNIKSDEAGVEVLVLTGKVSLSSRNDAQNLIVLPNEKAVYDEVGNKMAKVSVNENERVEKITGTEYSMRFNATMMQEIIQRIEGKFNVRISVSDTRLANCTITADFTDQSLERTLNMISQSLGIEYEIHDNLIMLKGAGCDGQ